LDLQVLVIATNDHEQVFVMQEFAQRVPVLQRVPLLQRVQQVQVLVLQRVPVLQAQPQLSVLAELHHVVLLQLVHSMKKLKKSRKKTNPKSLGYMF
jgi:hypothetical protein